MRASIDEAVRGFARFLTRNWDEALRTAGVLEHFDTAGFMADWVQANWELLVETPFRDSAQSGSVYLEPYGEGAECNDPSSRVWNPDALPTHRVVCLPPKPTGLVDLLARREIDPAKGAVVFDHLASQSNTGWHEETPPFDCVLGYQGDQEVLVRLNEVSLVTEEVDVHDP